METKTSILEASKCMLKIDIDVQRKELDIITAEVVLLDRMNNPISSKSIFDNDIRTQFRDMVTRKLQKYIAVEYTRSFSKTDNMDDNVDDKLIESLKSKLNM